MKQNWTYKKLGELGKISSGKSISSDCITENFTEGLYPCYGGNGLRGYVNTFLYDGFYPIIGRVGALCGNVHLTKGKFYPTEHALVMVTNGCNIPEYIVYALKSMNLNQYAKGVAQPVLSASTLSKLPIPLPPLSTQSRIVSELDLLQSIIDKQKAQLKELDNLAQVLFYDMFGDPVENEKGWERIPFESSIQKVKYTTKLQSKDYLDSGKYPIISQEEEYISGYWNNDEDLFRVVSPVVIFGDHTRILKYVDFSFVLGADGVKIFLPISAVTPWYLYYFLKSSNIPSLGYSRHYKLLKELTVPIPPLDLQQSFTAKIESIEKHKAAITKSIEETQKLFDYTMDKYFGE